MRPGFHLVAPLFLSLSVEELWLLCFWFHVRSLNPFMSRFHSFLLAAPALSLPHRMTLELLGRLLFNRLKLHGFMGLGWTGTDVGNVSHHATSRMPKRRVWDVTFSRSTAYKVMRECDMVWANSNFKCLYCNSFFQTRTSWDSASQRDLEKICRGVKGRDNCSKECLFGAHRRTTEQNN